MKNIILLLGVFIFPVLLFAQDDVHKIVANETCACIQKKDLSKIKDRSEIEMLMGLCMLESAGRQNLDVDLSDQAAMHKFGEKVGVQMALICPEVFASLFKNSGADEPTMLSGQVKSVDVGEFVYINFKEDSGKEHRLIWTRYFPGSDEFMDNPKKLAGKKIRVAFTGTEFYSPKSKAYFIAKEITELQLH
ncbi:MAG TPA: hypothetical protein PLV21_17940 [Cyclobacteriaceae bacterium]|nr:hypothetical protein [Cyclobacteriaceae bacterium]HRJ83773.1 hypothetical protein [Cyclobacteriaceae bacterium]